MLKYSVYSIERSREVNRIYITRAEKAIQRGMQATQGTGGAHHPNLIGLSVVDQSTAHDSASVCIPD